MRDEKLAATLERIATNAQSFYDGDLANDIIDDLQAVGAIITAEDLKQYNVNVTEPVKSEFDGKDFYSSVEFDKIVV